MQQTILTKTSSKGQQIEVRHAGQFSAELVIDGQRIVGGTTKPIKLQVPKGEVTYYMGTAKTAVGLTTAEAKLILGAVALPKVARVDPATTWCGDASMDAADSIF